MTTTKPHRGTIFLENAEILTHEAFPGEQYVVRLHAPECAEATRPGQFVHLQCHPLRPMRRPISIMRASPAGGWVDLLYKVVGEGTALLAERRPGERLSVLGPVGEPFRPGAGRPRPLLLGGGVGMPPMICLAEALHAGSGIRPLVILGSEAPFPFDPRPSGMLVSGMPAGAIACMPLLEDWGIPSRLTSLSGFSGCHPGYVTDLARRWLLSLDAPALGEVEVFACGPHPMLQAAADLAREFRLPCQVSLEELMACGVGGCAGCTLPVTTDQGPAMKRVCVDGPVFDAAEVFPTPG
ncbi:MAG: dihydroorotate dehydrogenase electron transfer subunit [Chromatiales bacterium]|jgi:dihydroorotate dehydrogenase electron transfer subunit